MRAKWRTLILLNGAPPKRYVWGVFKRDVRARAAKTRESDVRARTVTTNEVLFTRG